MAQDGGDLRLQTFIARSGAASRRAAEALIAAGRISVNSLVVREQGCRVCPEDDVRLDGKSLAMQSGKVHIALNKPPMYICTSSDPEGRPLALDLIPAEAGLRLFSIGRLDFMSCGLVLFTNDGDFAAKLGHPRAGVEKEYMVEATGHIPDELLHSFENGVNIEGERYRAKSVRRVGSRCVKIVLVEGRNREIRRVFSHFRLHPLRLRRIRIGSLYLGDLAEGQSRRLGADEVAALLEGKESVQYGSRFDRPGEKPQALQSRPRRPVSRAGEKSLKPKKELTW